MTDTDPTSPADGLRFAFGTLTVPWVRFVADTSSRRVVGRSAATTRQTPLIPDALETGL